MNKLVAVRLLLIKHAVFTVCGPTPGSWPTQCCLHHFSSWY